MNAAKKPKNLRLRRKLDKLVSTQRKIDYALGHILLDLNRLVKVIDKINK